MKLATTGRPPICVFAGCHQRSELACRRLPSLVRYRFDMPEGMGPDVMSFRYRHRHRHCISVLGCPLRYGDRVATGLLRLWYVRMISQQSGSAVRIGPSA